MESENPSSYGAIYLVGGHAELTIKTDWFIALSMMKLLKYLNAKGIMMINK